MLKHFKIFEDDFFDNNDSNLLDDYDDIEFENKTYNYQNKFVFSFDILIDEKKDNRSVIEDFPMKSFLIRLKSLLNICPFFKNYELSTVVIYDNELLVDYSNYLNDLIFILKGSEIDSEIIKDNCLKIYDFTISNNVTKDNYITVSFAIEFDSKLIPRNTFIKFMKSIYNLFCIASSLGVRNTFGNQLLPRITYYNYKLSNNTLWNVNIYGEETKLSLYKVDELGKLIFGTDNKYWSNEAVKSHENQYHSGSQTNDIATINDELCPQILIAMQIYFKNHIDKFDCLVIGYCKFYKNATITIKINPVNSNFFTTEEIKKFFEQMIKSFSVSTISQERNHFHSFTIDLLCNKLPSDSDYERSTIYSDVLPNFTINFIKKKKEECK